MIAKRYLGRLALALCTVWTLLPLNVLGQEAPAALRPPLPLASSPAPLASAKNLGLEPLVTMIRAEIGVPEEIEGIRQWNAAGRKPMKVGFFRSLPVPQEISLGAQYLEQIEGNEGEEPQRADGALGTLNPGVFRQTEEGLVWAG